MTEPAFRDLRQDLNNTPWLVEKVRSDSVYAQNLYAAMCNNEFQYMDTWYILKDLFWSCSWRTAGGIVAELINSGDYMDWYCSGSWGATEGIVSEGVVTDEVREDLFKLNWKVIELDTPDI